jgi:putative acetyltransferase
MGYEKWFSRRFMIIRAEELKDQFAVFAVNQSAFETSAEANLVDILRKEAHPIISLVAEDNGAIIGHIMFSPVSLSGHSDLKIMGLGPMAVIPERQGEGTGSALVKAGLEMCKDLGVGAVIVLGHPGYYPRFGFVPSVNFGIRSDFDVPPEVFMLIELQPGYLQDAPGIIQYHAAFNGV